MFGQAQTWMIRNLVNQLQYNVCGQIIKKQNLTNNYFYKIKMICYFESLK